MRIDPWRPLAFAALLICFGVTGCSTRNYRIAIDSNPPGARVEINNEYVGETPLIYTTYGNANGTFRNVYVHHGHSQLSKTASIVSWTWSEPTTPAMGHGYVEFVAKPLAGQPELYVQRKLFKTSYYFSKPDQIPEKILFDLHEKPEPGSFHWAQPE